MRRGVVGEWRDTDVGHQRPADGNPKRGRQTQRRGRAHGGLTLDYARRHRAVTAASVTVLTIGAGVIGADMACSVPT